MNLDQELDYARLKEAEAKIHQYCAWLERDRVGDGVLAADMPTGYIREAFGWPQLPEKLIDTVPDEWL